MKTIIKNLLIFLAIITIIAGIYTYSTKNYVTVRFDELGPITKNMGAYYNGFKIGKIVNIKPDDDFKHTLVKVNLNYDKLNLPQNVLVYVERFPSGEQYIQFVYPESPSLRPLKRGDILEGISPSNIEEFMLGQNISRVSDLVSIHVIKALDAMDVANKQMEAFFKVTSKILEDNDKGIKASVDNTTAMTKSLALMAENLNQSSKKINKALDSDNLKETTKNLKDTTENISIATKDLDKTMQKLDDTMTQINSTAQNLNSITSGVNESLSKKFGGMRVMLGTPTKNQCKTRNACK